jgi:hypothetical protein
MIVVPTVMPLTMPEPRPTVATAVLLLVQVPPPPSVKVVVEPTQTLVEPDIADGSGFTVTTVVAVHPPVIV